MLYAEDMLLYRIVDNPEDLGVLQQDIDTISDWVSTHHLTLNNFLIIGERVAQEDKPMRCNGPPLEHVREHTVKGDLME